MTAPFRPGQRWVSISEPELGLGEVRAVGPRTVTVAFPATGDTRQYARAEPPLRRAAFRAGDTIATVDRQQLTIDTVVDEDGLLHYRCGALTITETSLSPTLSFSDPVARLLAGHFDAPEAFDLRRQAILLQHRTRQSPVRGFLGGRIDLLPHQLRIAADVTGRMVPRVLLADEVGLGKTIEAGLILHRLIVTGRVGRVLVLVPASLVHQWFVELLRRFNLWFHIYDEERCAAIQEARPEANPFLDAQLVLADIDLIVRHPTRLADALAAGWDALVVDEAHHLEWTPDAVSQAYAAVEALGRQTPSLLLLTATPEQLGLASHFARLRLLDPGRFHDLDAFSREAAGYRDVARIADALRAATPLSAADRRALAGWLDTSDVSIDATLARVAAGETVAADAWIDALMDRHGTGRVMFRNRRTTVGGFPTRIPHLYPLEMPPDGHDCTRALHREWIADRGGVPESRQPNLRPDPRVDWLVSWLRSLGGHEKVLLICRTAPKALAIEAALRDRSAALKMATFHEGLTLVQRDRGAAWFADPDGARLLICSEIGSEGRNFQFARHLVLFDLPLDPALLEQRIGRLDRIGQRSAIHVHVPYVVGSHLEVLARWYQEGLNAFAVHVAGGRELLEQFEPRITSLADHIHDRRYASHPAVAALVDDARDARGAVAARLEAGRDRLLEWNSFRPHAAARLIDEIRRQDSDRELDDFLLAVLDAFVVEVEELAPRTYRLGSAGVLVDEFPGLSAEGLTVTADRQRALAREHEQFLTWDHPLVAGALDLLAGSEKGNCAFWRWPEAGARHALYLEALYVVECIAPPAYHVDRFLPPTPIRVTVDHRGQPAPSDLAPPARPPVPADRIQTAGGRSLTSRADVRDRVLPRMVEGTKGLAEAEVGAIIADARAAAATQLAAEVVRLRELQKVNRSVRDAEISALVVQQDAVDRHIAAARLRLDSVRLIHRGPTR